jgi:hypothetical protein
MRKQIIGTGITLNLDAVASIHEDGLVILNTRQGKMFSSNRIGARIWRGIEQQLPFDAIADQIGSEYQVSSAIVREHAALFLAELDRHNLIERGAAS